MGEKGTPYNTTNDQMSASEGEHLALCTLSLLDLCPGGLPMENCERHSATSLTDPLNHRFG